MADYGFIANPPAQNGFAPISSMLDMAGKAQQLQRGNIGLQLERGTLAPKLREAEAHAQTAETGSQKAALGLTAEQAHIMFTHAGALAFNPDFVKGTPEQAQKSVDIATKRAIQNGAPPAFAQEAMDVFKPLMNDPTARVEAVRSIQDAAAGVQSQQAITRAPLQFLNNNQQAVAVQPQSNAPGGIQPGASMQMQLPPSTQTFNPQTNAPGYLGPQAPGSNPIQSGPGLGVQRAQEGVSDVVNQDWTATNAKGSQAGQNISVLQEIKKYAKGAVTGVTSDRRAFIAGLAGVLGINAGDIAKTDTDLLAKNTAMLAGGGSTDLGRTLLEMSNPNTKMTDTAILKAADQVIAQQKLAIARQQFLQPFAGDPAKYTENMTKFNAIADPRILQLQDMDPADKAKMKAAMSPQEQKDFGSKIRMMYQLGILK